MVGAIFKYVRNVAVALDRLANAILLGDPEETISARLGKYLQPATKSDCTVCRGIAKVVCWFLDKVDPDHCGDSIAGNEDEGDDAFI